MCVCVRERGREEKEREYPDEIWMRKGLKIATLAAQCQAPKPSQYRSVEVDGTERQTGPDVGVSPRLGC